jgi:hypothetical protein
MKKFLILFILTSCSSVNDKNVTNINLDFNNDLSFEDFNKMLKIYTKNNSYPNITN